MNVAPVPSNVTEYSRSRWKPWADKDVECQDARHKFLTGGSKDDVAHRDGKRCRSLTDGVMVRAPAQPSSAGHGRKDRRSRQTRVLRIEALLEPQRPLLPGQQRRSTLRTTKTQDNKLGQMVNEDNQCVGRRRNPPASPNQGG